jgi:TM2 domain-containing membrane protein YozV
MSQDPSQPTGSPPPFDPANSKRTIAGLLAIFLGAYGVHRFYLGDTKGGVIRILCCFSAFGVISIIEGIMYLMKTDEQFYQEYIVNKKAWF